MNARRLSGEHGFTLIELLVATFLMLIVLSATLNSLDVFTSTTNAGTKTNDQQDRVRFAMDRLTKQLRNLANPTTGNPSTIAYADNKTLVFQTTDPNRQWVMYCVDSAGILWYEASAGNVSNAPGGSPAGVCQDPAGGWVTKRQLADSIANGGRPVFSYESDTGPISVGSGGVAATDLPDIIRITVDLFLDINNKPPPEIELSSGVHLRNQFAPPTAQFSASDTGPSTWLFDASASTNPQGSTAAPYLQYAWYMESGTPTTLPSATTNKSLNGMPDCTAFPASTFQVDNSAGNSGTTWTCLGAGLQLSYNFANLGLTSPVNVWLRTINVGNLANFSSFPAAGCPAAVRGNPNRADDTQCLSVDFAP